jgi:hypothetical protein
VADESRGEALLVIPVPEEAICQKYIPRYLERIDRRIMMAQIKSVRGLDTQAKSLLQKINDRMVIRYAERCRKLVEKRGRCSEDTLAFCNAEFGRLGALITELADSL